MHFTNDDLNPAQQLVAGIVNLAIVENERYADIFFS